MPLGLDPQSSWPFVLASDSEKPEAARPTFLLRHLTGRQWLALSAALDGELSSVTSRTVFEQLLARCGEVLAGWRNMVDPATGQAIVFAPEAVADVLSNPAECYELLYAALQGARLTAAIRKNSAGPSSSVTGSSARAALPPTAPDDAAAGAAGLPND